MKKCSLSLLLLFLLLFFSSCRDGGTFSFEDPPPNRALLRVDAPAVGIAWQSKKIKCKKGEEGLCADLSVLLEQLAFPPRSETVLKTLDDDYEKLQDKARFSSSIDSSKGTTSLPPGRGDSFAFPVQGQELTAVVSGSVAEVRTKLISPGGQVLLPGSSLHEKTPYLERFIVPNPESGTWRLVSENRSASKPVYSLTYETFVAPFAGRERGIEIEGEVLDDGEVVLTANDPLAQKGTVYEWDLGDGWAGYEAAIGHYFKPGTYIPELLTMRQGAGETLKPAPFLIKKEKGEPPEIIPVNEAKQELPSPPKLMRAQRQGDEIRVAALPGSRNGGGKISGYQYSLDRGGSWQDIELLNGYFTLLSPEDPASLEFRAINPRGPSTSSVTVCNFSGFYPLEATAKGLVEDEKVDITIRAGGCQGERWNILASLWKRAGIF